MTAQELEELFRLQIQSKMPVYHYSLLERDLNDPSRAFKSTMKKHDPKSSTFEELSILLDGAELQSFNHGLPIFSKE